MSELRASKREITGILVNPIEFYVGDPAGTVIANATVQMSSGSFSGGLEIGGQSRTDFQPAQDLGGGVFDLVAAIVIPDGWMASVSLIASQNNASNSPFQAGPFSFSPTPAAPIDPPTPQYNFVLSDAGNPLLDDQGNYIIVDPQGNRYSLAPLDQHDEQ